MARRKAERFPSWATVMEYVDSILEGRKIACPELVQACRRFKQDLENPAWDLNPRDAEFVIRIIETTFVHQQGERLDGTPLRGQPFLLEPFHKFIVYNLLGFFLAGTKERRYKEALIYIPRKNIKTSFAAALAWGLALLNRRSGSKVYIVAAALKQSLESFNFINFNLEQMGEKDNFRVIDNNQEHSIQGDLGDGSIFIQALAANPDRQDSLNCNVAIADEMHAYKTPKQYNIIREAMNNMKTPVAFHLDHGAGIPEVLRAFRYGATGVMIDASRKPLEENIAITKGVVEMAAEMGIGVEGELGEVGKAAEGVSKDYTKVEDAAKFVNETGVCALAVAVGTAHGHYKQAPVLALKRIEELREGLHEGQKAHLVLHGGSGVPDDQIAAAVKIGRAHV